MPKPCPAIRIRLTHIEAPHGFVALPRTVLPA
jgi:hypothetical protein